MKHIPTVFLLLLLAFIVMPPVTSAQIASNVPLSGYAWSSTIGWINFSGSNYGVEIQTDGTLVGYAWSEHIGWIKFGNLSSFPSGGGNAAIDFATGEITGWARACAGTASGDCSTMNDYPDGWDGWISLSCETTGSCAADNSYGIAASTGDVTGYAWGAEVVGWVSFAGPGYGVTYGTPCSTELQCSDLTTVSLQNEWCESTPVNTCTGGDICISGSCTPSAATGDVDINPGLVRQGERVEVQWSSSDAAECTLEQQNAAGNAYQSWTGVSGDETSNPVNQFTVFSLQCNLVAGAPLQEIASTSVRINPNLFET